MENKRFKLNKKIEQNDLDYLAGAGLGWTADSCGQYVFNEFEDGVILLQIRALERRGYFVEPDLFQRPVEKRELPNSEELAKLSRKALEERLKNSNRHRGKIQESLNELSEIGGYLDLFTIKLMQGGYAFMDIRLEEESFAYMNAMTRKRP